MSDGRRSTTCRSPRRTTARPKPPEQTGSYTMVDPRFREIYFQFYKETYKPSVLDRKTKELVAISASLAAKCQGCLEGHIKKALKFGATREEISETIAIAMGVNAAAIVDLTDIAADNLGPQAVLSLPDEPSLQERYAPAEHLLRLRPRQREGPAHPQLRRGRRGRRRLDAASRTTRPSRACSTAGSSAPCSTATATGPPRIT